MRAELDTNAADLSRTTRTTIGEAAAGTIESKWAARALGIASSVALLLLAAATARAESPIDWRPIGGVVEHAELTGASLEGHAFRFSLSHVALRLISAPTGHERVSKLAPTGNAIAVNASFFDEAGRAMGLGIDRGRSVAARPLAKWGALVVDGGRARVVRGLDLGGAHDADLVVQGLPRLVSGGRALELKAQRAARTAVCADGERVTILVTTNRIEANDFARLLAQHAEHGGFGCTAALNLDGGPSTQLHARWHGFSADVTGGWGVPNALVAVAKD